MRVMKERFVVAPKVVDTSEPTQCLIGGINQLSGEFGVIILQIHYDSPVFVSMRVIHTFYEQLGVICEPFNDHSF